MKIDIPSDLVAELHVRVKTGEYSGISEAAVALLRKALPRPSERNRETVPLSNSDEEQEQWRQTRGFSAYEVSTIGRVRKASNSRLCTVSTQTRGYGFVSITRDDGVYKQVVVHKLVAEAFLPNPDRKPQVNHKDGIKKNNQLWNLEWATEQENAAHSVDTGLRHKGGRHWRAILTEDQVREIIDASATGSLAVAEMAKRLKVTETAIRKIQSGASWKHIKRPDHCQKTALKLSFESGGRPG